MSQSVIPAERSGVYAALKCIAACVCEGVRACVRACVRERCGRGFFDKFGLIAFFVVTVHVCLM